MALVRATHRFARISATKVRPFADLIRGKSVQDGINALRYHPNRGARFLEQVLKSAAANAEDRGARNVERLTIKDAAQFPGDAFSSGGAILYAGGSATVSF